MTDVILHIYNVTNSGSDKMNNTIMQINKIFKDGIGLGGIFHSAFRFMEMMNGHLVFVNKEPEFLAALLILRELSREWPGFSYDLLSRNCNNFCDELFESLGVPKLPGWVNRFANAGDAAVEIAGSTAFRLKQAKTEIVSASKVAYRFLSGIATNSQVPPDSTSPNRNSPRFQVSWFKNLIAAGDKPSTSSVLEEPNQDVIREQQGDEAAAALLRQNGLSR